MSNDVATDDEISAGLAEAVEEGLVSRRLGPDGEWLYSMTDAGSAYVESMPDHPQDGTAGAGVPDTRTLITTPDVEAAAGAMRQYDEQWQLGMVPGSWTGCAAAALDAAAPGLRARWVAEALEEIADAHAGLAVVGVDVLLRVAAEYRDRTR